METALIYPYVFDWKSNELRAELKDKPCRIVARGSRMHSILIEFEDGRRLVTSAWAVKTPDPTKHKQLRLE